MTEKLFENDSYLCRFTARVERCETAKKGFAVVLDRTAFFPEGGGQPADLGVLGDAAVLDVQEKDGEVLHFTDTPLAVGAQVEGAVDWARRFDLMQQHTADHIFSALVHRRFGFENVGFHIGAETTHMDFSGELSARQIDELELEANRAVMANLAVTLSYPGEAALAAMEFRSKKELSDLSGRVRIVTIGDLDVCACCGTHVAATGEVGLLKITGCQSYKGGVRVFMAAGERAFLLAQREHHQVEAVSGLLSAKQPEIVAAVTRLKNDDADARLQLGQLQGRLLACRADAYAGRRQVLAFEPDLAPDDLRRFALLLCERGAGLAAVFSGGEGGYKYALATGGALDARALGKEMNALLAGRGGGKPELVQGSVACTRAQAEAFFAEKGISPDRA